tara:strand:- start:232 stop:507 length:276 start_codon:yes stop_codon:yes gene_type:complete
MSFLSGQVLAQSTPKLDEQIAVAEKEVQELVKKKEAVLAKRKAKQAEVKSNLMATPKLDKQIAAAKKAGDKAKVQKLIKQKRAVIAKRKAK